MNKFIPILLLVAGSLPSFAQTLETIIQKGHELAVVSVAVSSDSNFVATGSKDKSIKLWQVSTGREIRSLLGHEMTVSCLTFSPDGKYILSGSYDKTLRLWDVTTGKEIYTITTDDMITAVGIDPRLRFFVAAGYNRSGSQDSATVFDFKTRQPLTRLPVQADEGRGFGVSLAISPDGQWLGFGEDNRVVTLYKTGTWQKVRTLEYAEGWCGGCSTMLTFSPDSRFVYMASHNGPLKKYELAGGTLLKIYEEKTEDLTGLAISPDGKTIVRTTEKDATVWQEDSGRLLLTIPAEEKGAFHKTAFMMDSKRLLLTSDNNTAFAWSMTTQKKEIVFTGLLNNRDNGGLNYDPNFYWQSAIAKYVRLKNHLLITPDGKTLIKGKFGAKVKQWDIASGKAVMEFTGHKKAVLCYDLSRDGKKLLTGGGDGRIILWDMQTGDSLRVIDTYREPIFDIHFNSDETLAASCSWDATMKIHNLETGKLQTYVEFESYSAYNILLHPNDLYLVAARLDNTLQMFETDTRAVVRNFVGHTDIISCIRFSPDQKTLMSASWDGTIRLWDMGTGLMTQKLKGHRGAVLTALFSSDGRYIYSAGADRTIRVWQVASSKTVKTFEGHKSEVTSLLLSPDNKMLISHSVDGVTKFWDMATGQEFFEHIHLGETDWMVKSPEGYFNATDGARKYIHYVSGLTSYAVDQFFHEFYRPDLLPRIFQRRGSSPDKGIQGKLLQSPPPSVKVAVVQVGQGKAEVFVRVTDNGGGAGNLKIYHNGKSVAVDATSFNLPAGKGESSTCKHVVELVGGNNAFAATASNRDQVESDAQTVEIFSDHVSKSSTCHVLAVGINQYKNPRLSLNYAKPDAVSFSKLMNEKGGGLFKAIELHTLYDGQATREQIFARLEALAQAIQPQDVFIFYYAGHGSMVDNQFYFIPTETLRLYDASSLHKDAIDATALQDKFKHIKALKQLIIMDACQSGGSVELLANRGASEEKAIAQLSRSAGIHVMASAGSEQFAAEFTELGHGLFTHVLIRALQGEADGAPKDGKVTIYELKSFIDDQVPEMTRKLKGRPQYPYTFSRGQDFPLVVEQ